MFPRRAACDGGLRSRDSGRYSVGMHITVPTNTNPAKKGDVQALGRLASGNPNANGMSNHTPKIGK